MAQGRPEQRRGTTTLKAVLSFVEGPDATNGLETVSIDRRITVATTQEALQITAVVPSFTVDDLQKSISFYEALGFTVSERWEDKGTLQGVMLRAGKTEIGLSQDDWKKGRDRKKGVGLRLLMSTTQNVDEVAARARSAGITLKSEPFDSEWKTRVFEVVDPSGFLLTISSESVK
jgi:uncharacterized glyoxalase superfamily protein PhnB